MTGPLTLEFQAELIPLLEEVFADLGQDLVIVHPGGPTGTTDNEGRRVKTSAASETVRGYLYALDLVSRARLTRGDEGLNVPRYAVLLPFSAPVSAAGWHIEAGGVPYYPLADAVDLGAQGVAWEVPLGAPGQRRA